jgi:hypothetical protein
VDSGTTGLLLPSAVYSSVVRAHLAPAFGAVLTKTGSAGGLGAVVEWMEMGPVQCSAWSLPEAELHLLPSLVVALLHTDPQYKGLTNAVVEVEIPPW